MILKGFSITSSIGEQIINRRKSLGWSAYELARRAGACPSTVWAIESGKTIAPTPKTLRRLESALEIPLAPVYSSSNAVLPLGEQIRNRRQELRLTQREAAKLAGIGRLTLQSIEHGGTSHQDKTMSKICKALGIELDTPYDGAVSPLGREVRWRRLEKNMSIIDLAEASGIARSTISDLEHGKTKTLREEHLCRLKKVLQMDAEPDSGEELPLGASIRKARTKAGFSRVEFASLTGITVGRLQSYEGNKIKKIPAWALSAIANVFLTLENDVILSMPDKLWEQLRSMEQQNMLDEDAAERLRTLSKQREDPAL